MGKWYTISIYVGCFSPLQLERFRDLGWAQFAEGLPKLFSHIFVPNFATYCFRLHREKIGKISKISDEKLVFSPQILYINLRWNAVNAVKLCKFTARVSREFTKMPPFHRLLQVTVLVWMRTSHLLHGSNFFFHCAISHANL